MDARISWKKDCRHSISPVGYGLVRTKYHSGVVVEEQFTTAAIAVIRGNAVIVDAENKRLATKGAVICRRRDRESTLRQLHGVPIRVIDPGEEHQLYMLPWSTINAPLVSKDKCRPVGKCVDAGQDCGGCCNRK